MHVRVPGFAFWRVYTTQSENRRALVGPENGCYTFVSFPTWKQFLALTIAENSIGSVCIANAADHQRAVLDTVRRLAVAAGISAFLVGGPVRDFLLGVPVNDLDISVVGDAPELARRLSNATGGRLTVHPRFGTASVAVAGFTVDLVTARRETYPKPAALPVVTAGSLADDLARRDFTVNAMALPLAGEVKQVVDPHGGQADLDAGIIRTLHRESFRDDPTRIFRAVRYEQRFAFRLGDDTRCDLESAVAAGAIAMLSGDRLRHELDRILHETSPLPALQRAEALGILTATHPALGASHLDGLHDWTARPLAWLAALVWPLHESTGSSVAARLNTPSDWMRVVSDTATLTERLPDLAADRSAPSDVCALLDRLSPDALAAGTMLAPAPASGRIRMYLAEWWTVAPLLRGPDLLALGVPPGPAVGAALRALRRARLDGLTHSRQDEQQLARQWAIQSK